MKKHRCLYFTGSRRRDYSLEATCPTFADELKTLNGLVSFRVGISPRMKLWFY